MRIWSIHPKYLDVRGLVALWRETLLAKHVLMGETKGYKSHPQLIRFRRAKYPLDLVNQYLSEVYHEAERRNFNFDKRKIDWEFKKGKVPVTKGQLNYEVKHLLSKLKKRDIETYLKLRSESGFKVHPVFRLVKGEIEEWEIVPDKIKTTGPLISKQDL